MYIMMVGPVSSGKTTLCQKLAGLPLVENKTQTIIAVGSMIDTPGEYLESRRFWNRLVVSSADAELLLLVLDCGNDHYRYTEGIASMFGCPVAGLVTKADIGSAEEIQAVREALAASGASPILAVSAFTGEGIESLVKYVESLRGSISI
jgi:ethanolamine utilization protein EutP